MIKYMTCVQEKGAGANKEIYSYISSMKIQFIKFKWIKTSLPYKCATKTIIQFKHNHKKIMQNLQNTLNQITYLVKLYIY